MTRRRSDEVSLNIVMALLVGVSVGIAVALMVGGIGAIVGRDWGSFAGGVGVAVAAITVAVALRRFEQSDRKIHDARDACGQ